MNGLSKRNNCIAQPEWHIRNTRDGGSFKVYPLDQLVWTWLTDWLNATQEGLNDSSTDGHKREPATANIYKADAKPNKKDT